MGEYCGSRNILLGYNLRIVSVIKLFVDYFIKEWFVSLLKIPISVSKMYSVCTTSEDFILFLQLSLV